MLISVHVEGVKLVSGVYERFFDYLEAQAQLLGNSAGAAAIFPNAADKGRTREEHYAQFLRGHIPHWCKVVEGGFLFNATGDESGQLDIIVVGGADWTFSSGGKSFSSIEGAIAVVSVKSNMGRKELRDALSEFSRIPLNVTSEKALNPQIRGEIGIMDFPLKIVYASGGLSGSQTLEMIDLFYRENPSAPDHRRPDIIHVNGCSCVVKGLKGWSRSGSKIPKNQYNGFGQCVDVFALAYSLDSIRKRVQYLPHILFNTGDFMHEMFTVANKRGFTIISE